MQVTVMYSPGPREVLEWPLSLPAGSRVEDALRSSGLAAAGVDWRRATVGVWGRQAALERVLREGDRIEVYRPLLVDPKAARRERFARQGGRTGGLFTRGQNRRGK